MTSDSGKIGGIVGKKLAMSAVLILGVVLLVRRLRGGSGSDTDAEEAGTSGVDTTGGVSTADTAERKSEVGSSSSGSSGSSDSSSSDSSDGGSTGSDLAENAADTLSVDTDVKGRFDEIDIVDAIYILMAGLKAAREEYRQRTDQSGA